MRTGILASALWGAVLLLGLPQSGATDITPTEFDSRSSCRFPVDFVTSLQVDLLDDDTQPPGAWKVNSGVLPETGEVRFRVFALSDDERYNCNVTGDFKRKRKRGEDRVLRVKVHAPGVDLSDAREFRYDAQEDAIVYRPRSGTAFGRWGTETLDFVWHAKWPYVTYTTRFALTIPRR